MAETAEQAKEMWAAITWGGETASNVAGRVAGVKTDDDGGTQPPTTVLPATDIGDSIQLFADDAEPTRMKSDDVKMWPMPQHYELSGASLTFDPQTLIVSHNGNSQVLRRGIDRFKRILLPPPSASPAASASRTTPEATSEPELLTLQIVVQSPNNESLGMGVDESYNLTVKAPVATLRAATVFGALYGLETFSQLVNANGQEWSQPFGICWTGNRTVASGTVRDWPRFGWRGLLLETGSHFYPVALLQRMIDAMAANRLNALHWSLYDVGSIPLKLNRLPLLSRAAYAPDATYSHADITGLQQYAKDRGVRLVPNYPQPAHLNSFCDALGLCAGSEGRGGLLDPSNPDALPTFQKLFAESAKIFEDAFVHIYDDEAHYLYNEWNESAQVRSFMANLSITTFPALETWLEKRITKLVLKTGKTPIVWESHTNFLAGGKYLPCHDQVVCDSPGWMTETFDPAKVIATAYIEPGSLWFLLDQGYQTLFATDHWYLDYDSGSQETTPWQFYLVEPLGTANTSDQFFINATAEQRILGGHVSMWAQNTDEHNLESRVWPAASAIAERLWSAKNNTIPDVKHVPSELKLRLSSQACRMQQRGIRSAPYLDGYCCPRTIGIIKTDDDGGTQPPTTLLLAPAIDIGDSIQLFADDLLVASSTNLTRTMHSPAVVQVAIAADAPWEKEFTIGIIGTSVVMDGDKIRVWYQLRNNTLGCGHGDQPSCGDGLPPEPNYESSGGLILTAYAESTDGGRTFVKPLLHRYTLAGSTANNIIGFVFFEPGSKHYKYYNLTHLNSIFIDRTQPRNSARRFRGVSSNVPYFSPDGYNWTLDEPWSIPGDPLFDGDWGTYLLQLTRQACVHLHVQISD